MVVLRNCGESESDKAIEYSEELNGFYFPPSPSYFPLYSPPSPPRPSSSNSSVTSNSSVIVKAKYGRYIIKFQLYRPWEKAKLEEQVKKRLPELEAGTYLIKYKDDEDGELILITCDEDLQFYIQTSRLQGTTTSIEVLLEQK